VLFYFLNFGIVLSLSFYKKHFFVYLVVDEAGKLIGVFTDGDLRRKIESEGKAVLDKKLSDFDFKYPITINADALLYEAVEIFKKHEVDNIVVMENNQLFGMLDIQDFVKLDLIG